jgi:hypothetical protein
MSLVKAEKIVGAFKEPDDSVSHHSSILGSKIGEETPPVLIPGYSEVPAASQEVASLTYNSDVNDPFNTTSSGWTFGGHLAASLQSEDPARKRSQSAEMSVLFDNLCVIGAGLGATYQNNVSEIARAPFKVIEGLFSRRTHPEKRFFVE